MKYLFGLAVILFTFSGVSFGQKGDNYGKGVTLTKKTKVSSIFTTPKNFVGKTVLVEGTIIDVCEKRGCWMEISGDKKGQKIKVKVDDGVIVFPVSKKGHKALVEGVVEELVYTKEELIEAEKHKAEEQGTKFDASTIKSGKTVYRIKGSGAKIF
ncbi:MAG: DUF4920 domain-containing protein [Ignavibacteriales bacterium]|jgi:hypothetical protein|nr:DUF4920 domain-containing protein [Ignavibacteriales bacterium]MBK8663359.1 DUF4920 domain-containing protein [Ignavibacteriales bacterium]MBP7543445.1 DUF4920 domain-containing protein [Ignavibacteriaceae bacterium]MBP9123962.1 DUF4920 domain-containing protein [Ignavibacteriaceae bacterium]